MPKKKKSTHGGYRPGAGRPTFDGTARITIAIAIPAKLAESVDSFAKLTNQSRSAVVVHAIERLNLP